MWISNPIADPEKNVELTNAVDGLFASNAQQYLDSIFVQGNGLQGWQSQFFPGSLNRPRWYYGFNELWGVFLGGGTENPVQGNALMQGYATTEILRQAFAVNSYLTAICADITATGLWSTLASRPRKLFCGHSLGGAVSQVLALLSQALNASSPQENITFGSPKAGVSAFGDALTGTSIVRWMNDDDPVPLVPPTVAQCPLLALVTDIGLLLSYNSMRHTNGGLQIDSSGVTSTQILPTDAAISPTTNLGNWLASLVSGNFSPHNLAEYRRRIGLNITPSQIQTVRTRRRGDEEPQNPMTRKAVNAEIAPNLRTIFRTGAQQSASPINVPPDVAFKSVKLSGVWYVTLRGNIIAIGPTRRKSSALALAGNQLLTRMLRLASFDQASFTAELTSFMDDAADPTSAITPKLQTS